MLRAQKSPPSGGWTGCIEEKLTTVLHPKPQYSYHPKGVFKTDMDSHKGEFGRLVEQLLDRAVEGGLELPIVFVMVSVNGYISAIRYSRAADGTWDTEFLLEGAEPAGVFPINLCFFDPTGRIFNAKVDDAGATPGTVH